MSFIDERERALILELLQNRLSESEFRRAFPVAPGGPSATGLAMLERAERTRDPVAVEYGLLLAHRFGISEDYLEVLCKLAAADWHERHEDVVDGLAKLKSPASVDALYALAVARYSYRNYDEACSLELKAIRTLGAIQTAEAVERLGALLRSDDDITVSEAFRQLARVAGSEVTDGTRALARRLLALHRPA